MGALIGYKEFDPFFNALDQEGAEEKGEDKNAAIRSI